MIEFRIPMKKILFGFAWLAATAALTARPDINTVGARGLSNKAIAASSGVCQVRAVSRGGGSSRDGPRTKR